MAEEAFEAKRAAYHQALHNQRSQWTDRKLSRKVPPKAEGQYLDIDRAQLLESASECFSRLSRRHLVCADLWVRFKGEEGVDEGGVYREFISSVQAAGGSATRGTEGSAAAGASRGVAPLLEPLSADEPDAGLFPTMQRTLGPLPLERVRRYGRAPACALASVVSFCRSRCCFME